uniref:LigA n=1 Tax=Parastrongyloides trichosuri TaxID=131310 RepID=A0A0N4Z2Z2_PARTI
MERSGVQSSLAAPSQPLLIPDRQGLGPISPVQSSICLIAWTYHVRRRRLHASIRQIGIVPGCRRCRQTRSPDRHRHSITRLRTGRQLSWTSQNQPATPAHEVGGGVDRLDRHDPVAAQVEDGEGAAGRIAAHQLAVGVERQARDLQLDVILVGPEPRHFRRRGRAADDGRGHLLGLFQGVGHALQPVHDAAVDRDGPPRHIADRVDVRVAGAGGLIDHHAVLARQARSPRQGFARQSADADKDGVRRDQRSVGQPHAAVLEARDLDAGQDLDAVFLVQIGEEGRQGLRRHAGQHPVHALDHHRLGAQGAGRGRRLQPDIAAADHRQPFARRQHGLQPLGVIEGAQLQQVGPVRAGDGQFAGRRAGGEDQRVVRLDRSVGEGHGPGVRVNGARRDAGAQGDVLLGVEALGTQQQVFQARLPFQPGFRQGRALIGRRILLPRQDDLALIPILPQQRRRRAPRVSRADDHNLGRQSRAISRHGFFLHTQTVCSERYAPVGTVGSGSEGANRAPRS